MKKISIIVPIYMVEKYLNKCIDSIINQTYKNLEIILVDDGSRDNCGKICDEYKKIDNRITVIHKENGGVSSARNVGLSYCTGDIITFIDPDDYIAKDYIEYMCKLFEKDDIDIAVCNLQKVYENKKIKIVSTKNNVKIVDKILALKLLLYQKEIDCSACGKFYKKEIFKNIIFPEGKIYEDMATTYKAFMKANKIAYTDAKKYFYFQREESIIGRKFRKENLDVLDVVNQTYKDVIIEYPQLDNALKSRIITANFYILRIIEKDNYKESYIEVKENIKKYRRELIKDRNITLKTRIGILISYINIDLVRYIYNFIKRIERKR